MSSLTLGLHFHNFFMNMDLQNKTHLLLCSARGSPEGNYWGTYLWGRGHGGCLDTAWRDDQSLHRWNTSHTERCLWNTKYMY